MSASVRTQYPLYINHRNCSRNALFYLPFFPAGFNLDCSVLFINMGTDDVFLFGQGSVLIEWELVGPVEFTECRLETRVEGGDDIIGPYMICK